MPNIELKLEHFSIKGIYKDPKMFKDETFQDLLGFKLFIILKKH